MESFMNVGWDCDNKDMSIGVVTPKAKATDPFLGLNKVRKIIRGDIYY